MKCKKAFDKMRLLLAANALSAYPYHNKRFGHTVTPLTSSLVHVLSKNEGRLPTSHASWQNLSKTILQWTKKCFPSLLLLKNFEVYSSVRTFMFLRIIKTWHSLLSKHNGCYHCTKIEDFSPMLHYIKGLYNILANNLSRLHCLVDG
jgi:hypothetical protein